MEKGHQIVVFKVIMWSYAIHKGQWKQTDNLEWSYPCPDTQVSWMIDHKREDMSIITSMKREYRADWTES